MQRLVRTLRESDAVATDGADEVFHELIFRQFLRHLDRSTDEADAQVVRDTVLMCESPSLRVARPELGCFHVTHPSQAWWRVVQYLRGGVTPACPRCPCCRGVLDGDDLPVAHERCPLWPRSPIRAGCCWGPLWGGGVRRLLSPEVGSRNPVHPCIL